MPSRLFIAALWSPEGKGMTSWLLYCDFVIFQFGILGHVWYLIVSIPDPCCLSYFEKTTRREFLGCIPFNMFNAYVSHSLVYVNVIEM